MPDESREVAPGPQPNTVRTASGEVLAIPAGWALLPPGDPAMTRRVKKAGPSWTVKEKRGRKMFSRGVWAPANTISAIANALEQEREDPAYARKLEAGRRRREREQQQYMKAFESAVMSFLRFHPAHEDLQRALAWAITEHAVPVGSGTVARTQRIPIERRAEAATIAWLRHQTTSYDDMKIPRVKGMRREVRQLLAERSRRLLARYRRPPGIDDGPCLLSEALSF